MKVQSDEESQTVQNVAFIISTVVTFRRFIHLIMVLLRNCTCNGKRTWGVPKCVQWYFRKGFVV